MRDLAKRLADRDVSLLAHAQSTSGRTFVRDRDEAQHTPEAIKPLQEHLAQHLARPEEDPTGREQSEAQQGIQKKVVVNTGEHRFLLKPYFHRAFGVNSWEDKGSQDMGTPLTGWGEQTNQAVYHAAGMGDVHQQVHVVHLPHHGQDEPMVAVRIAPKHRELEYYSGPYGDLAQDAVLAPKLEEQRRQAARIATLDTLAGNGDRHSSNVMVDPETHRLLAIDNGHAFSYHPNTRSIKHEWSWHDHADRALEYFFPGGLKPTEARDTMAWWGQVSPAVRQAFKHRLGLVKHPALRQHLQANFDARADQMDRAVAANDPNEFFNHRHVPVLTPGTPK